MIKEKVIVPAGIRYMSEWKDFVIPDYPCIIDKKIPGCGFTEYCITNSEDVILCSPRKILLSNKEGQHPGEILYVKNELDQDTTTDKDLEKITRGSTKVPTRLVDITPEEIRKKIIEELKNKIKSYVDQCYCESKPIKILVTYDSFRLVKETLGNQIKNFRIVIDEFQSIFTDSRFKSDTELSFMHHLQGLQKVCYVSATPMIDTYLERLDEFKDLPYIELDWSSDDPLRVLKPDLKVRTCKSVNEPAYKIIKEYLDGNFESISYRDDQGIVQTVESKEVVFYLNSVTNILGIINKCELKPEQCNILVADTPDNKKKLKRRLGRKWGIGDIPLKGESHKMFTFCTRTVYLGADFYSTNARTVIISDANIDTLAVDISLDLPQILGRQRLNENPWKNRAEFYYKTSKKIVSREEFDKFIEFKLKKTGELLENYDVVVNKHTQVELYKRDTTTTNYRFNYVAVNEHSGKDMFPELNRLVLIAEQRAFDIQQIDYKDRFTVFNTLANQGLVGGQAKLVEFIEKFNTLPGFYDKMKVLCEAGLNAEEINVVLDQIPLTYKKYYIGIGPDRCRAKGYSLTGIKKEYDNLFVNESSIVNDIYNYFQEGSTYTKKEIKEKLSEIYLKQGLNKNPKATDLEEYFEVKASKIVKKGISSHCFKLIKKKG